MLGPEGLGMRSYKLWPYHALVASVQLEFTRDAAGGIKRLVQCSACLQVEVVYTKYTLNSIIIH